MEFNFDWRRLLLLAAFCAGFAWVGGFTAPQPDQHHFRASTARAWTYCVLLYLTGAASASVVDHYVGLLTRTNLRLMYVVLGLALMGAGLFWLKILKQETETPPPGLGAVLSLSV
ncbi:hypothetical protein [Prosthecobacter sp.]|uniref:hypothetical protein n=1 Tax=Prosthecobacter sp. TaxID=1965333 RepID=UPI003783CCCC